MTPKVKEKENKTPSPEVKKEPPATSQVKVKGEVKPAVKHEVKGEVKPAPAVKHEVKVEAVGEEKMRLKTALEEALGNRRPPKIPVPEAETIVSEFFP